MSSLEIRASLEKRFASQRSIECGASARSVFVAGTWGDDDADGYEAQGRQGRAVHGEEASKRASAACLRHYVNLAGTVREAASMIGPRRRVSCLVALYPA